MPIAVSRKKYSYFFRDPAFDGRQSKNGRMKIRGKFRKFVLINSDFPNPNINMDKKENNYAYIDGQNLNLGIQELGWRLDYKKFRIYLKEKYGVTKAFYFIGFVAGNSDLYTALQNAGYILIFKPTFRNRDGKIKGNIDAELVLQAMIDYDDYEKAVIITGDGDFHCLVKHLREKDKLKTVLSPNLSASTLIKTAAAKKIAFMENLRNKLEYVKAVK